MLTANLRGAFFKWAYSLTTSIKTKSRHFRLFWFIVLSSKVLVLMYITLSHISKCFVVNSLNRRRRAEHWCYIRLCSWAHAGPVSALPAKSGTDHTPHHVLLSPLSSLFPAQHLGLATACPGMYYQGNRGKDFLLKLIREVYEHRAAGGLSRKADW